MTVGLDGQYIDTLFYFCLESFVRIENNLVVVGNTPNFILRQGIIYDVSDSLEISLMVYLFHPNQQYTYYTTEVYQYFLNELVENTLLVVEVTTENGTYRNRWIDDWSEIKHLLKSQPVDPDETLTLVTQEVQREFCTDNWSLLPLVIDYSGVLKNEELTDSIQVTSLSSRLYMFQI